MLSDSPQEMFGNNCNVWLSRKGSLFQLNVVTFSILNRKFAFLNDLSSIISTEWRSCFLPSGNFKKTNFPLLLLVEGFVKKPEIHWNTVLNKRRCFINGRVLNEIITWLEKHWTQAMNLLKPVQGPSLRHTTTCCPYKRSFIQTNWRFI